MSKKPLLLTKEHPMSDVVTEGLGFDLEEMLASIDMAILLAEAPPMNEGETIAGKMTDRMERMCQLIFSMTEDANSIGADANTIETQHQFVHGTPGESVEDCVTTVGRIAQLDDDLRSLLVRRQHVEQILLHEIRLAFGGRLCDRHLDIRAGGVVVKVQEPPETVVAVATGVEVHRAKNGVLTTKGGIVLPG